MVPTDLRHFGGYCKGGDGGPNRLAHMTLRFKRKNREEVERMVALLNSLLGSR